MPQIDKMLLKMFNFETTFKSAQTEFSIALSS